MSADGVSGFSNLCDGSAHGQRLTLGGKYSQQLSFDWRRDLHSDLVGHHFNQRFVATDGIARLLQPFAYGPFDHRLANIGEFYRNRQLFTTCL